MTEQLEAEVRAALHDTRDTCRRRPSPASPTATTTRAAAG